MTLEEFTLTKAPSENVLFLCVSFGLWRQLPGGDVGVTGRAGQHGRGSLLAAQLLELCDDHLAAVDVAVEQGQQLGQH